MKKILVIGVGSAGMLTLCQLCSELSDDWIIYSVHDPKIPILGVGESTSTSFPAALFHATDFVMDRDSDYLDSTYKFNVKYTNWRKNTFDSTILTGSYAMHFDNTKLKDFVFERLLINFPQKIKIIEGNISNLKNIDLAVEATINDKVETFDYVIDCGGFPKNFSEYNMIDLPLNRAIVVRKNEPGSWTYTHHLAHKNGWMFGIPLKSKQGWGYMYNDTITSQEDAINDLCDILHLDKYEIEPRNYSFKSYYAYNNLIDGRVFKNGNKFMFFEPMEALSIEMYFHLNQEYIKYITNDNKSFTKQNILDEIKLKVEGVIMFYNFVYHGGSIYNTKFWEFAKKSASNYLKESKFEDILRWVTNERKNYINSTSSSLVKFSFLVQIFPFMLYTWEKMDKNLGYEYFKIVQNDHTIFSPEKNFKYQ